MIFAHFEDGADARQYFCYCNMSLGLDTQYIMDMIAIGSCVGSCNANKTCKRTFVGENAINYRTCFNIKTGYFSSNTRIILRFGMVNRDQMNRLDFVIWFRNSEASFYS